MSVQPLAQTLEISIHALREEDDLREPGVPFRTVISIHALREEGDSPRQRRTDLHRHFYPRPP